ncbi:MAG: hydroxymethylglutaryl-CoA reductase, degradative [Spirochaetaceae bacterium]|nr:hydroxymethylglutaryl-CoA reductase, degradative [Spirochaetaceae bacterium]MDT8298269.1 hydroxymethylglutaryl-CoA reductase, degradative [Spirochaetaceae bacterium]
MIKSHRAFRKGPIRKRREIIESSGTASKSEKQVRDDFSFTGADGDLLDLAEVMVEQAVGYLGLPLGVAGPLLIDGKEYMIPMATEEPSVVAAASFAGHLLSNHGGIVTHASEPVMVAQIFLEDMGNMGVAGVDAVMESQKEIRQILKPILKSMEKRGGGWRDMDARWIAPSRTLAVNLRIDVRDAMGANLLNSAAEEIRPLLERVTGGRVLMAILSNRSWDRTASARLSVPLKALARPGFDGSETARRIVRAARVAREDPDRAVTHNKGIMNGISALALATGNDTRAIEAAAHAYAGRYGPYHGLSEYWIEKDMLHGSLELPLPFAVTGGAVGFHPVSRWCLELMGHPDAPGLSRIAAAVGLAQNLSALRALVSEGIQQGHMALHARRLAYDAGARGEDISGFAALIRSEEIRSRQSAAARFAQWQLSEGVNDN